MDTIKIWVRNGSCISSLRRILLVRESSTMPPLHHRVRGHRHDSTSLLLSAPGLGTPGAVCYVVSGMAKPQRAARTEARHYTPPTGHSVRRPERSDAAMAPKPPHKRRPTTCTHCGILLNVPCLNPGCAGHQNDSLGDWCRYCATNQWPSRCRAVLGPPSCCRAEPAARMRRRRPQGVNGSKRRTRTLPDLLRPLARRTGTIPTAPPSCSGEFC
jgi:hypothetical protein